MIFNAEDNKIVGTEFAESRHKPIPANYLNDAGVNVISQVEWAGSNRYLQSAQHRVYNRAAYALQKKQQNHILPENLQVQSAYEHSHHDECVTEELKEKYKKGSL